MGLNLLSCVSSIAPAIDSDYCKAKSVSRGLISQRNEAAALHMRLSAGSGNDTKLMLNAILWIREDKLSVLSCIKSLRY